MASFGKPILLLIKTSLRVVRKDISILEKHQTPLVELYKELTERSLTGCFKSQNSMTYLVGIIVDYFEVVLHVLKILVFDVWNVHC